MINLIGKWKAAEMIDFNAEKGTMDWAKVEDILAKDDLDKDTRFMANMVVVFGEDGTITLLTALPEGVSQAEVDAAVKAGQLELRDGMMFMGEQHWKVEDGKNMTDTGLEGELLGEKVGPWEEVKEIDDHTLDSIDHGITMEIMGRKG